MRSELYSAVRDALLGMPERVVVHVDLWNHNVEFIEQEEAWPRPAVFVEFAPIEWRRVKGAGYRTDGVLRLHVVTDWDGQESSLEVFDLCERIREAMLGLSGASFTGLKLLRSDTNHNHEDIVESIEVFGYCGEWLPESRRDNVPPRGTWQG